MLKMGLPCSGFSFLLLHSELVGLLVGLSQKRKERLTLPLLERKGKALPLDFPKKHPYLVSLSSEDALQPAPAWLQEGQPLAVALFSPWLPQ